MKKPGTLIAIALLFFSNGGLLRLRIRANQNGAVNYDDQYSRTTSGYHDDY